MKLPPPLNYLYDAWMGFSHVLGRVMSFIILTILWIVGFGIYACIMKISKYYEQEQPKKETYWIEVPRLEPEHLLKQF